MHSNTHKDCNNMVKWILCQWNYCFSSFSTYLEVLEHCKREHISYSTEICHWKGCNYTASNQWSLISHINTHLSICRGFCFVCNKQFKWTNVFQRHVKMHQRTNRPFFEAVESLFSD